MKGPFAIAIAFLFVFLVVALYDLMVVYVFPGSATVSAVIQEWAVRWPALGLAVGFLLGHLFWPVGSRPMGP